MKAARPICVRPRGVIHEIHLVTQQRERRVTEVCARGRERGVERLAHVDDPEHTIRTTRFEPRAAQSLLLDRIGRFAETRRIDDRDGQTVEREMLAERIARRARNIGHDRGVVTRQPVQKARLARVRRPRDRHGESIAEHRARSRGACERREIGQQRVERSGALVARVEANFLVRKVEPRFDLHAQLRERRLQRRHLRRELAVERAQRGARRGDGSTRDEVRDRLRLQQIDLVVQERAQRELAGLGRSGAERVRASEQCVGDDAAAVPVQLDDVLAGVRARSGEIEDEAAIERLAGRAAKRAELRVARPRLDAGQRDTDRARVRPRQPYDRDRAGAGRRGEGCDRVVTLLAHGCSRAHRGG